MRTSHSTRFHTIAVVAGLAEDAGSIFVMRQRMLVVGDDQVRKRPVVAFSLSTSSESFSCKGLKVR
jgi:hypothetical protein